MSIRPLSIRRRGIADRTLRLSQPVPWTDGFLLTPLFIQTATKTATSSATANTFGAWVELFAAADTSNSDTIAAIYLGLQTTNSSATADNSILLDLAFGASSSETAFVSDIAIGGTQNGTVNLFLPVRIAGNTRIAFRVRGASASRTIRTTSATQCALFSSPFADRLPVAAANALDVIGTSQTTSSGTACSGSSGAWTQVTASTSRDYQAVIVVASGPGNGTGGASPSYRLDLGLGSGPEVSIASVAGVFSGASSFVVPTLSGGLGIAGRFIPAGSSLSIRHNLSTNPQLLCGCVIGVPYA